MVSLLTQTQWTLLSDQFTYTDTVDIGPNVTLILVSTYTNLSSLFAAYSAHCGDSYVIFMISETKTRFPLTDLCVGLKCTC